MDRPARILTVAFLFPDLSKPWLAMSADERFNAIVARACRFPCCHVELVFEDGMAFSIFSRSRLFFRQRSFANPEYRLISLRVPRAEYQAAYAFCAAAMTHEIGFNEIGIYAAYLQLCPVLYTQPSTEAGHTFCSKVVTEAMQAAGTPEAEPLVPCTTTPSMLYGALAESRRKIHHTVTYKCEQLRQVGCVFGPQTPG